MLEICFDTLGPPMHRFEFLKSDSDEIEARLSKYGRLFDRKHPVGKPFQSCPHQCGLSAPSCPNLKRPKPGKSPLERAQGLLYLLASVETWSPLEMCAANSASSSEPFIRSHFSYSANGLQYLKSYRFRVYTWAARLLSFASE